MHLHLSLVLVVCVSLWVKVSPTKLGILKNPAESKPSGYGTRPRGVSFNNAALYATGANFTCFNGLKMISFDRVNDNYCDCADGSDEPGTSACSITKFHCMNRGYKAADIPSNRVNDQICDCCDGSDEWKSAVECPNICDEMGAQWRMELQQRATIAAKGHEKRQVLIEEGSKIKAEKEQGVEGLRKERDELIPKRDEAEKVRNESEEKEKVAKEAHRKAWEDERDSQKEAKVIILFAQLDLNSDEKITLDEIKTFTVFDSDNNGEITDEEAKDYLNDVEECDMEHFKKNVYDSIRDLFPDQDEEESKQSEEGTDNETGQEESEPLVELDNKEGQSLEEAIEEVKEPEESATLPTPITPKRRMRPVDEMPDYDEATKKLMAEADDARKAYEEVDRKIRDLDSSISETDSYVNGDFGIDAAWAPLKGKWIELNDNQYTYKLCLFDRALQKDKNSGSETSLGNWEGWSGSEVDKYTAQTYSKGQSCWNGPDRSTKVTVECGEELALIEATEPSKCEYKFVITSPAACPDPATLNHEEL